MMLYWIIVGFFAGVLAKAFAPGSNKEPKGCIMTIILGIAGSVLTGTAMKALGMEGSGWMVPTIFGATIGALILILIFRKFWK